ncbi:MAG: NYN domain-containing protein [Telluria sp.]
MASSSDNISMAVFCDFENVALGVRDANYEKFDIRPVLERLLLKGSIVVKKAYCDWDRYKGFKSAMHEANFEMIEIPHVRQSGKNSADIRLVVDALDLCYTKSHVDTFVIISGDSDFSPLVSKLRENAKKVIGVGVKQSTSDLLVANCDEFIFYDDLVREVRRAAAKRDERKTQPAPRKSPDEGSRRKEETEGRKKEALDLVVEMFDALVSERGDSGKIWASLLKDTLKRRRPDFNESYYGFRTFGNLLEEAQSRGMLEFGRDEKSGAYVYRSNAVLAAAPAVDNMAHEQQAAEVADEVQAKPESRRRGGRGRKKEAPAEAPVFEPVFDVAAEAPAMPEPVMAEPEPEAVVDMPTPAPARKKIAPARTRKAASKKAAAPVVETPVEVAAPVAAPTEFEAETVDEGAEPKKPARKPATRGRRPAKPKATPENT